MAQNTQQAAGGLEGLNLGAPVAGGSAPTTGINSGSAHTTTTSTSTSGVPSGVSSGSHGHHDHHHHDSDRYSSSTSAGKPQYDRDAQNTTSGDRGIGGGHGGPTAFEADASDVGTDRKRDGTHDHSLGGLTGGYVDESRPHHHESSRTEGSHVPVVGSGSHHHHDDREDRERSHTHHSHDSSSHGQHHSGAGVAAGGAALLGAGATGGLGGAKPSNYEGVVGDSVTGQQHFKGSSGIATGVQQPQQVQQVQRVQVVPVVPVEQHTKVTTTKTTTGGSSHGHGSSHKNQNETGLVGELKQELRDHQKSGGYSDASKHPESDGPHGLVWHNGKYVHKRELDNHGSTGVPLK